MMELMGKAIKYYRQYGIIATLNKIKCRIISDISNYRRIKNELRDESKWGELSRWIDSSNYEFIDIFPAAIGWNTPLFQRFQHVSLNVGHLGGIAFYGAHPHVDVDVATYKIISPTLCLVNFEDHRVSDCFWRIIGRKFGAKIIRIQSIDMSMKIEEIESFLLEGYQVVYEYIDELTPQITGTIPEFVYKRHNWILENSKITIVATSDKLFRQVAGYRNDNMLMLSNGVDYNHWNISRKDVKCPDSIKHIIAKNKVVVGYHGAIAQWIDYELLATIAADARFVLLLIGYEHDDSLKNSGLLEKDNVFYIGARNYTELPEYAVFYDIAILPFKINDITLSVSPVKIFEYMALGKPIVTYALPECKKYKSCFCAENMEEFLVYINQALDVRNNNEYLRVLENEAKQNTWIEITSNMMNYVLERCKNNIRISLSEGLGKTYINSYVKQVLIQNNDRSAEYKEIADRYYERMDGDCKIIAYYLTQFHPDKHNEKWWGKGVTEWNNVCRAVPQYLGHYQPRLPGELGYYDLRIKENMQRQIELAKMYGIYAFSFYYYWFDGERLLENPLEMFLENKDLDMVFSLCWANENWTRRFDGSNQAVLIEQPNTFESYCNVITDIARFLSDDRYLSINSKKVLTIYRPSLVPCAKWVLEYWRNYCRTKNIGELYIIAVKENMVTTNWLAEGFDAVSEFHPGTVYKNCRKINASIDFIRSDFSGEVFSYSDIVTNKRYFEYDYPKLYRAAMPMWDNTARRDNKGFIFDGATPALYKKWLKDIIAESYNRDDLDDNLIFINAWNEWGEGAYLEPDKYYGYAYLNATKEAIEESRR